MSIHRAGNSQLVHSAVQYRPVIEMDSTQKGLYLMKNKLQLANSERMAIERVLEVIGSTTTTCYQCLIEPRH